MAEYTIIKYSRVRPGAAAFAEPQRQGRTGCTYSVDDFLHVPKRQDPGSNKEKGRNVAYAIASQCTVRRGQHASVLPQAML